MMMFNMGFGLLLMVGVFVGIVILIVMLSQTKNNR
jgi:hypothetical protein